MSIDKLKTKFITGTFINDVKHYFTKINEIIDWINNIGSTTVPTYKVYTALLSQSGTNDPTVVVLNNTLSGNINWEWTGPGHLIGTLVGAFPIETKVACIISPTNNFTGANTAILYWFDADSIELDTLNSVGTGVNDLLYNTLVEIRVYN